MIFMCLSKAKNVPMKLRPSCNVHRIRKLMCWSIFELFPTVWKSKWANNETLQKKDNVRYLCTGTYHFDGIDVRDWSRWKIKSERNAVNVSKRFFNARLTAEQSAVGSNLLLPSKMADGGDQALVGNGKSEDEEELDLAKCAAEFSQYCQVDVRKEVWHPSMTWIEKYFGRKIDILSLLVWGGRFMFYAHVFLRLFQSKAIEDIIEDMLVRLDEFSHLADTVKKWQ